MSNLQSKQGFFWSPAMEEELARAFQAIESRGQHKPTPSRIQAEFSKPGYPNAFKAELTVRQIRKKLAQTLRESAEADRSGEALVGARVRVFWEAHKVHYAGTVTHFDPSRPTPYAVTYDDDEVGWEPFERLDLLIDEEEEHGLAASPQPSTAPRREPCPGSTKRNRPEGSSDEGVGNQRRPKRGKHENRGATVIDPRSVLQRCFEEANDQRQPKRGAIVTTDPPARRGAAVYAQSQPSCCAVAEVRTHDDQNPSSVLQRCFQERNRGEEAFQKRLQDQLEEAFQKTMQEQLDAAAAKHQSDLQEQQRLFAEKFQAQDQKAQRAQKLQAERDQLQREVEKTKRINADLARSNQNALQAAQKLKAERDQLKGDNERLQKDLKAAKASQDDWLAAIKPLQAQAAKSGNGHAFPRHFPN